MLDWWGRRPSTLPFRWDVGQGPGAGVLGRWGRLGGRDGVQQSLPVLFQVVDMLALYLPPEKLCPLLVSVALSLQCSYSWVCLVSRA